MGYDIYGKWHAQNEDGSFTELDLGEVGPDEDAYSDWGRNSHLFALLGLHSAALGIPPVHQTAAPAGLDVQVYADAPAQGCVTLTDFLAYDYLSPEWQLQQHFAFAGYLPLETVTRRLREIILPRVSEVAQGRATYFTYVIG